MAATAAERRVVPAPQLTLAERVGAHMEAWPGNEFGGWIVAEDHRDGTAVVVWRQSEWGGNVRGNMLLITVNGITVTEALTRSKEQNR
jgi:hypothetical protein